MALVTESQLRAALRKLLDSGERKQGHVAEEIGEDPSAMSSWMNDAKGRPQFSETVRRRVSERVLKWLQKKKGMFTGRKIAGGAADDDDDNAAADEEEEEYEVSEGLRLQPVSYTHLTLPTILRV